MLKPIVLVSVNDPAIDISGEDALQAHWDYQRKRDLELLKWKPGATPIRWTFSHLSRRAREYCESTSTLKVRWTRAFQMTFSSVEGLDSRRFPWTPRFEKGEWGGQWLTDDSLDELEALGLAPFINEFGSIVYQRAYLDPFGGDSYVLPAGCVVNWARLLTATNPSESPAEPIKLISTSRNE